MLLFGAGMVILLVGVMLLALKKRKNLRKAYAILGVLLLLSATGYNLILYKLFMNIGTYTLAEPYPFGHVQDKALSHLNLKAYPELVSTLSFSNDTIWPWAFQLPRGFRPKEILNTGKNPGLGLRRLHAQGITGAGVRVAIIDQAPPLDHSEFPGVIRHFELLTDTEPDLATPSVHGAGVVSLLAGKEIGSAPGVEVFYFADPQWVEEPNFRVLGILRVLEYNKTLPEGKKIRIIAMSKQLHPELVPEAAAAIALAREQGVIVLHCGINMGGVQCPQGKDPDNPQDYSLCYDQSIGLDYVQSGALFVPIDNRTVAGPAHPDHYVYYSVGGFSWGLPWLAGVVALGLQVNPDLTEAEIFEALTVTAYPFAQGGIVQPTVFIDAIKN